ncbi:MAG: choice-of-anchor D domain-containing protein, partial [Mycobacteriales bacterium]
TDPASSSTTTLGAIALPAGAGGALKDAVSIGAGKSFASWVDHNGAVWGIGDNSSGQGGTGSSGGILTVPTRALGFGGSGQPKAVKTSAFGQSTVVLDDAGSVWQWGNVVNSKGNNQIQTTPAKVSFPTGTTRIIDVSAGDAFSLALDDAGRGYAWGKNDRGQLGTGTNNTSPSPARITTLPAVPAGAQAFLEAGRDFAAYTVSSGTGVSLYTWGRGDLYQLGAGTSTADSKAPKLITTFAAPAKALALSAGTSHTLLLTSDGVLRTWGSNGLAATKSPTPVADPDGVLSGAHHPYTVAAGDNASFAVNTDGTVAAWGLDTTGQLGRATTGTLTVPTQVTIPGTSPPTASGVPALITSRYGATYVLVDGEIVRTTKPSYDFPATSTSLAAGQTAPKDTVVFTNVATKPLSITSLAVAGANPNDFTLSGSTCTGTLALDATSQVVVTFQPAGAGSRQADLVLRTANTLGGLALQGSVPLTGRGYSSVAGLANVKLDLTAGSPTSVSGPGNVIPLSQLSPSLIPTSLPPTPSAQLGKIQLGKIPLLREGGWDAVLDAYPALRDLPVSSVTLGDLVDPAKNAPDPTITTALPLERVALSDVDIRDSFLAQLSVLSVLAGGTRLDQFAGVDWCSDLPKIPNGGACTDGDGLFRPLIALDVQGVSQETTRAGAVPIGSFTTDAKSTSTDPFADAVWPRILLNSVTLPGTRVGALSLTSLPNPSAVLDCAKTSCTALAGRTLGDPDVVAALREDASFRELGTALNALPISALVEPFMDRASYDWESLPVSAIPAAAYPNRVSLQADVDINCAGASGTTIGFKVPAGFVPVPGTTTLTRTRGTGTVPLADPTVDPSRGLVVSVPDSSFSSTGPILCTDDSAHLTVTTGMLPSGTAGSYRATADARTGSVPPLTATQERALAVTGVNDLPTLSPDGTPGFADTLVIASMTVPGQVQYVPFDAPVGKVIELSIAQQTADFDGVLYYPKGAALDPALSTATAPREVPFGESTPVEPDALHALQSVFGGALQEVPLLADRPVAAIAATRGTDLEQLSAIARAGNDSRHVLAIHGYNGATGSYVVRIRLTDSPALADCTTVPVTPGAVPSAAFYGSSGWAAGDNTLVLVNASRLAGRYGQPAAQSALDALSSYAHSGKGGVKGQVLQVDSDAAVRSAYAAWDAAPCDPLKADGVVRAINALVYATAPATLRYVVLAGGDDMLPHARLEDHTRDGNQREQAGDMSLNGGNPIAASFASGYYMSDDPYGTKVPQSVLGQVLYLPQAVPSRLGESVADIVAQANAFVAGDGVADPQTASSQPRTAVATDYDFLTSGGNEVAATLGSAGYTVDHSLTGTTATWTKAQLDAAWLGKASIPSVAALNMHYDQYRGLPAYGNATGDQSQVYDTADVGAGPALTKRIVFTIGCHSALDVPDSYAAAGDPAARDFAQAYAGKGVAAMVGNYGFGYADTSTVAYSAAVQSLFAKGLAAKYDLGTALSEAKRQYLGRMSGLSAYDIKTLQQVVVWGLPQYRLSSAPAVLPPAAPVTAGTPDPVSGQTSQVISVGTATNPLSFATVDDNGSTHLTAAATDPAVSDRAPHTVAVPGKPVLPAQFVDVPQVAGRSVRSVLPTSLTSTPVSNATVTFARASVDHGQGSEPLSVGAFPATLGHLGTALRADGSASNTLVVTPAEFLADGTAPGKGQLRTFPRSEWTAYYGLPGSATSPTITRVQGMRIPAHGSSPAVTSYQLDVSPAAGRTISRVWVLALPAAGSGTWVRTELSHVAGDRWVGAAQGLLGEFIGAALGSDGGGGISTQKGLGWQPQDLPAPVDPNYPVQLQPSPATPASGWFTTNPTVAIVSNGGSTSGYRLSIDGGAPVNSPATVTGDGVHVVQLVAPDGSVVPGGLSVLIDTMVPKVTITDSVGPRIELNDPNKKYTATYQFGPSGPASIVGDTGFITSRVGLRTVQITATSVAGLTGTASREYRVVYGSGSTGFAAPVLNAG